MVTSFSNVDSWVEVMDQMSAYVVVLSTGGESREAESIRRDISLLSRVASHLPMILLADAEELGQIVEALEQGVRGYIPTSVSLAVAIEAMRLVRAGGVYAPASCLIPANRNSECRSAVKRPGDIIFTTREAAVLRLCARARPTSSLPTSSTCARSP